MFNFHVPVSTQVAGYQRNLILLPEQHGIASFFLKFSRLYHILLPGQQNACV